MKNAKYWIGGGIVLSLVGMYFFMPDLWSGRSRFSDWKNNQTAKTPKGLSGNSNSKTPRAPESMNLVKK